jgi:hypothetical protein
VITHGIVDVIVLFWPEKMQEACRITRAIAIRSNEHFIPAEWPAEL